MAKIFISYSRKDIAFARLLHQEFEKNNHQAWVDWQDIPPSTEWLFEIFEAIEQADIFIFVISSTSVASETCNLEIAHARANKKRIIPIAIEKSINEIDPDSFSFDLSVINWLIVPGGSENFSQVFHDLITAIQTDYPWIKEHTRLQLRALEWKRKKKKPDLLLVGHDLAMAEKWLLHAVDKQPQPTEDHEEFITTSRKNKNRRRFIIRLVVSTATIIIIAVLTIAMTIKISSVRDERMAQLNSEMFQAVLSDDVSMLKNTIDAGAKVNTKDSYGWTPLHRAVGNDRTDIVSILVNFGADVNIEQEEGFTPLHIARKSEIVILLLEAGADIDKRAVLGQAPLHFAASKNHHEAISTLIESGADVNIKTNGGRTPLHFAALNGYNESVIVLIAAGAEVNEKGIYDETPLHLAADNGHIGVVSILLESGAEIDTETEENWTPLHSASDRGHDEVVLALLMAGAEIDQITREGLSSLHLATYNNHTNVVLILLEAGAEVNLQDISGLTPLHFAAIWGYIEILTSLLEAGAKLLEDYSGETPIDKAMSQSQTEVEILLRQYVE